MVQKQEFFININTMMVYLLVTEKLRFMKQTEKFTYDCVLIMGRLHQQHINYIKQSTMHCILHVQVRTYKKL